MILPTRSGLTARAMPTLQPHSFAPDETQRLVRKRLRLLLMREMAGAIDGLEARTRDHGAVGAAVGFAEHAVVRAPEKQRRDADAVQPAFQPRIMEIRIPGQARGRFA